MPRITPSISGGSATADRALRLLSTFRSGDNGLTLAELAKRAELYKSTTSRLLHSLVAGKLIISNDDGTFRLGGEILRLHAILTAAGGVEAAVMPILRQLVQETKETASLHVRQGSRRIRLYVVDSPQSLREHVTSGEDLPLDRGAGGLLLRAFTEEGGRPLQIIRRQGYAISIGGRVPELSGIAAPVFDARNTLYGALTLTMPTQRWDSSWVELVRTKASELTVSLGGAAQPRNAKLKKPLKPRNGVGA